MLILKTAAFLLPLIGLGGIAGAVETGTSPVNSLIVFCAGCLVMLLYIKLDKAVCWEDGPAARRKEETMSGFEIEELTARIKGMTLDEQRVAARSLQDNVLWGELQGRFTAMSAQLNNIRKEVM